MNIAQLSTPKNVRPLPSSIKQSIEDLEAMDRLGLHDFLRGGKLPQLGMLSRLCKAGCVVRTPHGWGPADGVRGAMAEFLASERRKG